MQEADEDQPYELPGTLLNSCFYLYNFFPISIIGGLSSPLGDPRFLRVLGCI
jgi:hypothetical protein